MRSTYNDLIETLSESLASGDTITIEGNIPLERDHLQWMSLQLTLSLMQTAARNVGGYIATAKLAALAGHPIQDIETWDDSDEAQSMKVKSALLEGNRPIATLGDDAQLLAGATMALLERPTLYTSVTDALNDGLDLSFQRDPIWGKPQSDRMIVRYIRPGAQTAGFVDNGLVHA